ncbi:MAG: septal ring lytic transglycosylase RlpA family protein [Desulfovibrionaceae bacterium]|nr:septal ring lytic transglycosylase RlpA family protein [Desulfovibrionaceae bacterium]
MARYLLILCLLLSIALVLSGCGSAPKRRSHFDPYTVRGKTYYPLRSADGYREVGIASWYGPSFNGKSTASGEKYDQNDFTCAHKTLPFGTKVKVTNLKNNRTVVVRVNDRGPFSDKRLIDISKAGAKELAIIGPGSGKVLVEALTRKKVKKVEESSLDHSSYFIQVGAFTKRKNAKKVGLELEEMGNQTRTFYGSNGLWNVQAGPIHDPEVEDKLDYFRRKYPEAFIVAN